MAVFKGHRPGTLSYVELASGDPDGSRDFYMGLFDSDVRDEDCEYGLLIRWNPAATASPLDILVYGGGPDRLPAPVKPTFPGLAIGQVLVIMEPLKTDYLLPWPTTLEKKWIHSPPSRLAVPSKNSTRTTP